MYSPVLDGIMSRWDWGGTESGVEMAIGIGKGRKRREMRTLKAEIDEELDAAAADMRKRAGAAPEEEAADLRADAADLLDLEFREAVLRSELALQDIEAARARGDVVSVEELEAQLERDAQD